MRMFRATLLLAAASCGGVHSQPDENFDAGFFDTGRGRRAVPQLIDGGIERAAHSDVGQKLLPENHLCVETGTTAEDVILRHSTSVDGCQQFPQERRLFSITKERSQIFRLYGSPVFEVCVGVERLAGYITISHDVGHVRRREDVFRWCVRPRSTNTPEWMGVGALTAYARFKLIEP